MMNTILNRSFAHGPFRSIDEVLNLVARDLAGGASCCAPAEPAALPVDIREREHEFVVEASIPGFRKGEVEVELHDGVLTITATRQESCCETKPGAESCCESKSGASAGEAVVDRWIRRERHESNLSRRVALPEGVMSEGIRADLADGILTVRIPKPAKLQPRKIKID